MLGIEKISAIGRTYRHLKRYRQILTVFIKYGFGDLIERLNIDKYVESGLQIFSRQKREPIERLSRAQRVRMALEELGPAFIKFGQILSTRPDLVPVNFIDELTKLQDDVLPFSFSEAAKIIKKELEVDHDKAFRHIDTKPIASASIGQVYKVILLDGSEAVIKVQRPGIRKIIEVDLEILLYLATLAQKHIKEVAIHNPVKIVEEFTKIIAREINYTIEASNMDRFARQFSDNPTVFVPRVFNDITTRKILAMEYVDGIKVSEIDRIKDAGLDPKLINARGARLFLEQIFDHGFFHADPHPGNIFVLPDNVVCLLDFGMVGTVDRQTREDFVDLLESLVRKEPVKATQILLRITTYEKEPDKRIFEQDVTDFMGRHLYKPLKEIKIGLLAQHLLEVVSEHALKIPPDIFLLMKAFGTIEGVGLVLDPDFDMISEIEPFIKKIKLSKFYPDRIFDDLINLAAGFNQFIHKFPKELLEISRLIRQKKLSINVEHQGMERLLLSIEKANNRRAFSIIIAALIIGSALITIAEIPPLIFGISFIGITGFSAAAFMGLWLIISIIRRGRL